MRGENILLWLGCPVLGKALFALSTQDVGWWFQVLTLSEVMGLSEKEEWFIVQEANVTCPFGELALGRSIKCVWSHILWEVREKSNWKAECCSVEGFSVERGGSYCAPWWAFSSCLLRVIRSCSCHALSQWPCLVPWVDVPICQSSAPPWSSTRLQFITLTYSSLGTP